MKSVLVTGGTVRLGAAIAERLRAEGWCVITSSHRADAGADIVADLAEPLGSVRLYAAALRLLAGTPPDALVNNAALFTGAAASIAAVNLDAPKKLTMMMAGRETGVGAVVNLLDATTGDEDGGPPGICGSGSPGDSSGSMSSSQAGAGYLESKRQLAEFTRTSAATFAATLRVNGVAPGPVLAPTAVRERAGETLLDRRPTADDVAAAVSFLLSAEAITGAILPVDSGQHLTKHRSA